MAAATAVEAAGTRRAVVRSERFMEWQRELSSSRAIHGGRKRHEETDMEATGTKKTSSKSEEEGTKPQGEQDTDEREAEGEEPLGDSVVGEGNGTSHRIKRKKQLHQKQRSDVKKIRKEHEVDQKRIVNTQSMEKSPPPAEGEAARMRRCKQQIAQPVQLAQPKRPLQATTAVQQQQPQTSLSQPNSRQRQRRVPRSSTPPKEEKDLERVLRSLTRNRGGETPPPAPAVPAGKGTKRSKRVALRLANEEPPPPPLKLPKLHLVLTRKEIQEDWVKITGHKYSGKPKKSTIVQRDGCNCACMLRGCRAVHQSTFQFRLDTFFRRLHHYLCF